MTTRTVRVTRTWDVEVDAEYGDTYQSLLGKVSEDYLDATAPDSDVRVVVEEHDSPVDKWHQRDGNEALGEVDRAAKAERAGFLARLKEWAEATTATAVDEEGEV